MRPSLLSTRSASRDRLTLARSDGNGSVDDTGDADARNYYEAASIANLRAQAAAVQNIRSLVPVVLDLLSTHYNRWHVLVVLTLECYILADHVLSAVPHLDVPSWRRMDCVVLSWLMGMLAVEFQEIVRVCGGVAQHATKGLPSRSTFWATAKLVLSILMLSFASSSKAISPSVTIVAR
jgi:hypothetical protein